jgi:hypothetical protein
MKTPGQLHTQSGSGHPGQDASTRRSTLHRVATVVLSGRQVLDACNEFCLVPSPACRGVCDPLTPPLRFRLKITLVMLAMPA